ncbi:hypothetical protein M378DRAFT_763660 [Amanita muscaria Koide BX008]|uniref:Uncharacterized protein n=1 Tax=Amanita muscaria (strain Koide BX008) TaxID=946122 RepID=A0A0C2TPD9_AMAMK|nr:hypothetical protein M378DRAFT_763660 [Amanita muscaria Koide BX008]
MWSLTWAFLSDWWRRNSVPGGACLFTHDILQYTPLAFGPASYRPSPLSGVSRSGFLSSLFIAWKSDTAVPLLQEQDIDPCQLRDGTTSHGKDRKESPGTSEAMGVIGWRVFTLYYSWTCTAGHVPFLPCKPQPLCESYNSGRRKSC